MQRNFSLDFFRGLMAFFVAIGHYFYWNQNFSIPLSFILAVDYFFILSGFVLAHSVLNNQYFDSFKFAKSRYLRLFPVYIFSILLTLIALKFFHTHLGQPDFGDIVRILIIGELLPFKQYSNFIFYEPLGVSWSISAEFWVGIIFYPILYVLHNKVKQIVFPFLVLIALISFFIINNYSNAFMNIHYEKYNELLPFGFLRALLGYTFGTFAYYIVEFIHAKKPKQSNKFISILQITILFLIIHLYFKNNYLKNNEYYSIFLFALMIISLSFKSGVISKFTNNSLGKWLGKISYPIYLLHPLCITITKENFTTLFSLSAISFYLILILFLSILTHIFIENKFMLYFKKKNA